MLAREKLGLNARVVAAAEDVVRSSNVLATVTPTKTPVVKSEWVTEGMHINAVGADAPVKEENLR